MRAWSGFLLGVVLIVLAWAADVWVDGAIASARPTGQSAPIVAAAALLRVALVAGTIALTWTAIRGPRSRLVGLSMTVVGFYVGILPQLGPWLSELTGLAMPPLTIEILDGVGTTAFTLWVATVVFVLGLVGIVRPTGPSWSTR